MPASQSRHPDPLASGRGGGTPSDKTTEGAGIGLEERGGNPERGCRNWGSLQACEGEAVPVTLSRKLAGT